MIGMELGGRYEVIDRIGSGGMAIVYKAHDILLNRKVAIKVLRQQYVHDEDFIRRFRREAQSAASLSHPNVVSIYDVGQEEDAHYIVMEYIEGSNLNEHIKNRGPFQVEEAIHIAAQICDALDHAHQNQIIHRDIKPHNILIGKNGRVKVTDFGIARAATSSDITQTGSVIGSVHYFSPEHAKGTAQGEKSDIYSLGIVLYQMLTNKLPFIGESPISVALKHLQEDVEDPRIVNSLIPQSVENIILKALRKAPEERYDSAKEMLKDLDESLLPINRDQTKIIYSAADKFDDGQTLVMPAIRSERPFAELYEDEEKEMKKKKKKNLWWLAPLIWLIVLAIIAIITWMGLKSFLNSLPGDVIVPEVVGLTYEEAKQKLEEASLFVEEPIMKFDDQAEENIVIKQDKAAGLQVKENSSITLTVSLGSEMFEMPDYVGQQWKDVQQKLTNFGLLPEQKLENSEEPKGTVIKQFPLPKDQFNPSEVIITMTVSDGMKTFNMPNLIGKTQAEAEVALDKVNLKQSPDSPKFEPSYSVPKGEVYEQFPWDPGEQASVDDLITIWVSTGYPDDALAPIKGIEVEPEVEGETSIIKFSIKDAKGERNRDPVQISSKQTILVQVIVSKNTPATIKILRNDKYVDTETVTYQDALNQNADRPAPLETSQSDSTSAETVNSGG